MVRPTLIDLNLNEFDFYPFMISLDKCDGTCNAADELSMKICVASETKYVNFKIFNLITRTNEAKTFIKHMFHAIANTNSILQHVIEINNWIIIHVFLKIVSTENALLILL